MWEFFWRILKHCEIGHFPCNLAFISGEWSDFHETFHRCIRGRVVSYYMLGGNTDPECGYALRIWTTFCWRRYTVSDSSCLFYFCARIFVLSRVSLAAASDPCIMVLSILRQLRMFTEQWSTLVHSECIQLHGPRKVYTVHVSVIVLLRVIFPAFTVFVAVTVICAVLFLLFSCSLFQFYVYKWCDLM